MKNMSSDVNPERRSFRAPPYWQCFDTNQAVRITRPVRDAWLRNQVCDIVRDAFCEPHSGWRMTICCDVPTDVLAYNPWPYENMQQQYEKVIGHRMRSLYPLVLRAVA